MTTTIFLESKWHRARTRLSRRPALLNSYWRYVSGLLVLSLSFVAISFMITSVIARLWLPKDISFERAALSGIAVVVAACLFLSGVAAVYYLNWRCRSVLVEPALPSIETMFKALKTEKDSLALWTVEGFVWRLTEATPFVVAIFVTVSYFFIRTGTPIGVLYAQLFRHGAPLILIFGYIKFRRFQFSRRLQRAGPRCLYLRMFSEDRSWHWTKSIGISPQSYMGRLTGGLEFKFCSLLERFAGPAVAVGRPGEIFSVPGIHRLYFDDSTWKENVLKLLIACEAIVVVVGNAPGIQWEMKQIVELRLLQKVVWLFYPTKTKDERLLQMQIFSGLFPEWSSLIEPDRARETNVTCIFYSGSGEPVQISTLLHDRASYREAIIIALYSRLADCKSPYRFSKR